MSIFSFLTTANPTTSMATLQRFAQALRDSGAPGSANIMGEANNADGLVQYNAASRTVQVDSTFRNNVASAWDVVAGSTPTPTPFPLAAGVVTVDWMLAAIDALGLQTAYATGGGAMPTVVATPFYKKKAVIIGAGIGILAAIATAIVVHYRRAAA